MIRRKLGTVSLIFFFPTIWAKFLILVQARHLRKLAQNFYFCLTDSLNIFTLHNWPKRIKNGF